MRPDSETLEIIIGYCDEIAEDMQRFGTDEEDFLGDKAYRKCIAFTVLQIGEQVKRLSKGLISTYSDVEWSDIARMRDFMAQNTSVCFLRSSGGPSMETYSTSGKGAGR